MNCNLMLFKNINHTFEKCKKLKDASSLAVKEGDKRVFTSED